jgi:hypothetical protein
MTDDVRPHRGRDLAEAWGHWVADLGEWHLFGGLTYDQRRRGAPPTLPPQVPTDFRTPRRLLLAPRLDERGQVRLGDRPVARDVAVGNVRRFLRQGQRELGRAIEAGVVALEYQRNGWPHFHPLLRLAGGLQDGDIATLGPIWYQLAGYGRLMPPRAIEDVCAYAAKYLAKGLDRGDVVLWPDHGDLKQHQPALVAGVLG